MVLPRIGFGLGMLVMVGGCFASSPSVDDGSDTGGTQSSESGSSSNPPATTSAVDGSSGSAPGTSTTTGDDTTSSTGQGSATGDTDDSTSTSTTGTPSESSSGGLPDWVGDCAAQGLTFEPTVPTASEPWIVEFEDPLPLTNVVLRIDDGSGADEYGVTSMCGMKPFCWSFDVAATAWPAGPISLSIMADDFDGAACDAELL